MTVIFGSNVADTTLSTACQMSTTSGGTETSNTTTIASTSNPYAEIRSKGGASTAVASLPAPTGNGWIWYPGAGTFALGNWSAKHTHSAVSHGVSTTIRFYKYSSGVYTSIGTITATQSVTAKTTYTHAATSMASVTLASGDGIYVDLWWFDNNANAGGDNPTNFISNSATIGVASDMEVTTSTFTPAATTFGRTVPATVALQSTLARTITSAAALQGTNNRTVPSTVALQSTKSRTVPASAAIANTFSRTVPATAALNQPSSRTVPASVALQATNSRTIPSTAALQSTGNARTIPTSAAFLQTKSRTVPATTTLANTGSRTVPNSAALKSTPSRTIPATVALVTTRTRTIPTSASLVSSAVFYASNVVQTLGGLTQSDQMASASGGTETSFTVTMPSSGTNSYVELLAQGGSSSATPVLPSPTGKGWSINLAGNTILAGNWSSIFTLAKSGTTKTGASLIVRFYRRTMDGTVYPIGVSTLSAQSFSTTKTVYSTPSVLNAWPWQFVSGDTLYMDAFVWNGSSAWSSDVFTIYVSNSATQGVYNDGTIIAPEMISTPDGLSCLIGATNFQTGEDLPIRDQSITIADAIDQRSVAALTGEDVNGDLSYQRAMPVQLSDSEQGVLYTGAVNSDKVSKPAAGNSNAQLEHALTFMDNHYLADKRKNERNYLNWSSGDMVCDFTQSTLSQEGITGAFALESDYTPETFGQGTLSGTVATDTTSPFTYAPNTLTPPVTSNTGDLELTRAGTKFTLTEEDDTDFATGTLTNMTASGGLTPSTQSAIKLTAQYSPVATVANSPAQSSGGVQTDEEQFVNFARIQVWSGSQVVGTSDTFNYDLWISSTSPAFMAGMDIKFSDGSYLSDFVGTLDSTSDLGLFDQNSLSVDYLQDLGAYAKDVWYTRNITLTGLNGKTATSVYVYLAGSSSGTYTVYTKNSYLGSHSGSPFFSTSATATQMNPPTVYSIGGYLAPTIDTSIVQVFNPLTSYRVSSAYSISGVGLVQDSTITWTASLPTSDEAAVTFPPGTQAVTTPSTGVGAMLMLVSYDGNCWLKCENNQALPGLPAGANVSGLSLYLREQFAGGSDPSAIPALLNVQITINSAAAQTVSDVVTVYGTSTQWNTGTQVLTGPNANGNLTLGSSSNPLTQNWASSSILSQQTLLPGTLNSGSQSVSGGAFLLTTGANALGSWCQSRFDWASYFQDGIIEADVKISSTSSYTEAGIEYRQTGWGNANNNGGYYVFIGSDNTLNFGFGQNNFSNTDGSFINVKNVSKTINANTYYHLKIVIKGNRHTIYFNGSGTASIDILDNTYTGAGQIGFRAFTGGSSSITGTIDNYSMVTTTSGTWTSPGTSISSLGTCGYNQVCWTDLDSRGQVEGTTTVLASVDNGSTWMQCTNGAEIPQLARGTSTSGMTLKFQMVLYSGTPPITTPIIPGLYVRVCGNYGTVTGTRISPALSLTPVGYVAASNCMYNANIPTGTSLVVSTTQDLSTFHTVGNDGAGESLPYWDNQPDATQDLFGSNTSANYTSTSKSGGSVASVTYTTTNSSLTLAGGSGALYLNNTISCADVDMLVDMDMSDAGGMVFRKVDASNFYEVGVYDASSSSGFTNQLRLYKVASGTRTLLSSASVIFTRGTFHRPRVSIQNGLINVYWDGKCVQSYLDTSPLAAGACGLRNDGGTSRYYQLWVQPLGTNVSGQKLQTKVTMTTTDPSVMPQLFVLVACVRGPNIATGATISQLHPVTKPVATYYHDEMDALTQASGDYFWLVDKWREMHFRARLARPGAFPVQSVADSAGVYSGYLLYRPQVTVLSSADLFRNRETITNVSGLVTPPPEIKVADGSVTSWAMGYPLYSAPIILVNGQTATVGLQGVDNNRQFYWQPGSPSISYDSSLPKLPNGTVLSFTYVGQSPVNTTLDNLTSQIAQAALELNSGIVDEITSALNSTASGMTTDQAMTFAQGLLDRYGRNDTIALSGTTRYIGLAPGTTIGLFLPEMMRVWNSQLPINKLTTMVQQGVEGLIWTYVIDATNGPNNSNWARAWRAK